MKTAPLYCSAHHAASAAAAVPGVHLKRACRHAERRRPDEAWNRSFAALVGRNHLSVWCAIESLQQDAAAALTTLLQNARGQTPAKQRCPPRFC